METTPTLGALIRRIGKDVGSIAVDEVKRASKRVRRSTETRALDQGLNHQLFEAKVDLEDSVSALRSRVDRRATQVRAHPVRALALTALGGAVLVFLVGRRRFMRALRS